MIVGGSSDKNIDNFRYFLKYSKEIEANLKRYKIVAKFTVPN